MNEASGLIQNILDSRGAVVLIVFFIVLFVLETFFALRRRVQRRTTRVLINTVVAIPAFAALRLIFIPLAVWIAYEAEKQNFGLLNWVHIPDWVAAVITFLLLDYGNYVWHILLHRLPILWRFHLVHHTDLDLDVTTAARFHFVELLASVIFRGSVIFIAGISPAMVLIYEIAYEAATQFHHSNMKLPVRLEQTLNKLFVTPRMHGIHHSIIRDETDSNYSIIFSIWDRLHRTLQSSVSQDAITIGVPSYQKADELTPWFLLILPFTKIRAWGKSFLTRNSR